MSKLAAVLLLFLMTASKPSAAQEVDYDLSALRARIDSLSLLSQRAQQAARYRDSIEAEADRNEKGSLALDSAHVGPFTLITSARDSDRVEELFARAWREAPPFVHALEDRLRGTTLVVAHRSDAALIEAFARRENHRLVGITFWRVHRAVEGEIDRVLLGLATQTFPQDAREWLGGAPLRSRDPQMLKRELALAPGAKAKRCHGGDVQACIDVLALREENPSLWYTSDELREWVRAAKPALEAPFESACRESRDSQACKTFVMTRLKPQPPLGNHMRANLLLYVLERSAAPSFDQFAVDSIASIEQRLRVASGDLEGAVRSWHSELISTQQPSVPITTRAGIASLFWIVVIAGFASRSTRWRLG